MRAMRLATRLGRAVVLMGAAFAFGVLAPGAQAQATQSSTRTLTASAMFSTLSGCTETDITLTATRTISKASGASTTTTAADINISKVDICFGQDLGTSIGSNSPISFSGDLNSATLNGTINVLDLSSSQARNVPVSVTWTGLGNATGGTTVTKSTTGDTTTITRTTNLSENATATGTIDGMSVISNTGPTLASTHQGTTVTQ